MQSSNQHELSLEDEVQVKEPPLKFMLDFFRWFINDKVSTDTEIDSIILEDYAVNKCIMADPRLREHVLKPIYKSLQKEYKGLLKFSTAIDHLDMLLAPVETWLKSSSLEYSYISLKSAECFVKFIFAITYITKTQEISAPAIFAGNEILAISLPAGNLLNIAYLYKYELKSYLKKEAAKRFIDDIINNYGYYGDVKNA